MNVIITGASGLVGRAVQAELLARGHAVACASRSEAGAPGGALWHPDRPEIGGPQWASADAIIHLAGENIAEGRWTSAKKARIRDSRVVGTGQLVAGILRANAHPAAFLCASAVGFYGDRADEELDESSPAGAGFLSQVCQEWERACEPLSRARVRVVNLRFGVILSRHGGALAKMMLPFKLGLGGVIGSGRQYVPWITLHDAVGAVVHCLTNEGIRGPVNVVSPSPVTNREFTKALGTVIGRPTIFPMPAFAARIVFGEMADALLLAGARVRPTELIKSAYTFQHDSIICGLRAVAC